MAKEEAFNPYADQCTVRIRVYLRNDGRLGRIDGPPTEGQNGSQELRARPDMHDDWKLIGVYDVTGSFIPFFPYDLNGNEGIEGWFKHLQSDGFKLNKFASVPASSPRGTCRNSSPAR